MLCPHVFDCSSSFAFGIGHTATPFGFVPEFIHKPIFIYVQGATVISVYGMGGGGRFLVGRISGAGRGIMVFYDEDTERRREGVWKDGSLLR